MCCKQPFYVSTAQFDISEWVDTLIPIWLDPTLLCEILLSISINLWLSTPRLSLLSNILSMPIYRYLQGVVA
jgi:hypothetical protein